MASRRLSERSRRARCPAPRSMSAVRIGSPDPHWGMLAPRQVAIGIPLAGRAQRLERGAGIADHPEVEARARVDLSGVDVDSDELGVRMKTRGIAVGDDVVHAGPDHEDQVRFAEGGRASGDPHGETDAPVPNVLEVDPHDPRPARVPASIRMGSVGDRAARPHQRFGRDCRRAHHFDRRRRRGRPHHRDRNRPRHRLRPPARPHRRRARPCRQACPALDART